MLILTFLVANYIASPSLISFANEKDDRDVCPEKCSAKLRSWNELEATKKKNTDLLGKNYAFLASITAAQASKFLKANSNRVIILQMLDDIKKQQEQLRTKMVKEGCESCLPSSKKDSDEITAD